MCIKYKTHRNKVGSSNCFQMGQFAYDTDKQINKRVLARRNQMKISWFDEYRQEILRYKKQMQKKFFPKNPLKF